MATRREDLAEALDALESDAGLDTTPAEVVRETPTETPSAENITATPETAEEAATRARDDLGRFAENKPAAPDPAAVAASQAPIERPEPPKSWKAEKRAVWDKLDPETAAYIHQREQESQEGFNKYRERVEPIVQQLEPHFQEWQKRGMDPIATVRDLGVTHARLSDADPATRLQTFVNIGNAIGFPIAKVLVDSGLLPPHLASVLDPNVMAAQQQARDLQQQLENQKSFELRQIEADATQQVENFRTTHPHVEKLGPEMQRLLQAGLATDLDSAYSKALRLNDELFTQTQAQQREAAEKERRLNADKAAKAAKANAVSTRTATPGSVTAATGGAAKGRRAALEDAFDNATASRI